MKNNHKKVEQFIRNAMTACSDDNILTETKKHLLAALNSVTKVSEKRKRNLNTQKQIEIEKKTQQEKWWEMIKRNAANIKLEKDLEDDTI